MNLLSRIRRLEEALVNRVGLPRWALKEADEWINSSRCVYNIEALEHAIKAERPDYVMKPRQKHRHPISSATDPEQLAVDLVAHFKTKKNFRTWQSQRFVAGAKKLMAVLEEIKDEVP